MFGHRYFGVVYFGPRYFGPADAPLVPAGAGLETERRPYHKARRHRRNY